jgi:hypothetical protein
MRRCLWTAATNGPTIHPPGDIWAWREVEWYWHEKTEELWEKILSQCHFVHHKSNMTDPGANPSLRGERPANNYSLTPGREDTLWQNSMWEGNIKVEINVTETYRGDWSGLVRNSVGALLKTVIFVFKMWKNLLTSWATINFWSTALFGRSFNNM